MRSFTRAALIVGTLLLAAHAAPARAADLDAKTGAMTLDPQAFKSWGFESSAEIVGAKTAITGWDNSGYPPKLTLKPVTDATQVQQMITSPADALQGSHGLRIGTVATGSPAVGLAIADADLFKQLVSSRVEVTIWVRADGVAPLFTVQYAKPEWAVNGLDYAAASSTRTGRETSDGWVEYTTGPIDGSVWGVPIAAIVFTASSSAPKGTSYVVDAVELHKVPGSLTAANACTQADVETTCGPMGECMYGHCVPSSITWGALPSPSMRKEFADRWAFFGSRIIGDRNASAFGVATMVPTARDLANYALSSRQFFGGMNRLVNGLRDNHTSFGSPPGGFSNFSPMLFFGWSGALHACFGMMEKDLAGGGIGFGVLHAGDKPITGVPLKAGDILEKIDGMDPLEWANQVMPGITSTSTNDPRSIGDMAENLSVAITARAKNITVLRCASSTKCSGSDKQEITIDVAQKVYETFLANGGWPNDIAYFGCSPRFTDSVPDFDMDVSGEDNVTARTVDGIVDVQFDGFTGADTWQGKWSSVFTPKPPMVLIDARQGNGGLSNNVQALLSLTRGDSEPIGVLTMVNGGWDQPSPSNLLDLYGKCAGDAAGGSFDCFGAWGFFATGTAPGASSKIAWVNTVDVSANDFMPRLLKGRSNLKIFAPVPSSGAFGAITSFAAFMPGWGGGSMQYQDSRFGPSLDALKDARWESSHGVEPDVVVAEKMSDAIDGKDTMLSVARAWLKGE